MMLGNLKLGMKYLFMGFIRGLKKQILSVFAYFFTTGKCRIYLIKFEFIAGFCPDYFNNLFFIFFPP